MVKHYRYNKFNKYRKLRSDGIALSGASVEFGKIALKALESGKVTKQQIESARMVISRSCGRKGVLFMRRNTFFPVTKKPLEVRMGGGKGSIDTWMAKVDAGSMLCELDNVDVSVAEVALQKASYKLNIPCKVVQRKFVYFE